MISETEKSENSKRAAVFTGMVLIGLSLITGLVLRFNWQWRSLSLGFLIFVFIGATVYAISKWPKTFD